MKRSILFALATVLLGACSTKEIDFQAPIQDDVMFYASFEQPADIDTKVYATEDLYLRWNADDRVSIFEKNTYNQQFRFTGETGDNAGGFKKVGGDDYYTGNSITNVVSVYPYLETTKVSESGVLTVDLPAEQHYTENTFGLGANTMVSVTSDNFLQYKNVGGYLVFKLYGNGVQVESITLKGNNGEKLSGKATVTMPLDGVPTSVMTNDSLTEITLMCDNPVWLRSTEAGSVEFWFVVPPVTFSKGFTIRVIDKNGNIYERTTNKSVAIVRNMLSKMEPFDVTSYQIYEYRAPISIDGVFNDWDKLDASKISNATCDPDATYTALKLVKVYADPVYVFVYFEWDKDQIKYEPDVEHVPFHIYLDLDGNASTGGRYYYGDDCLWIDAGTDLLVEGLLYNEKGLCSFAPDVYRWAGEPNGIGWRWEGPVLDHYSSLCSGAGLEGQYELYIRRDLYPLNNLVDNFSVGFEIEQRWNAAGILPNTHPTTNNPSGRAPSLQVKTVR